MASPRSYASTAKRVTNNSILYSKCSLGTDLFLKHLARTPILKYRQARFGPKLGRCTVPVKPSWPEPAPLRIMFLHGTLF